MRGYIISRVATPLINAELLQTIESVKINSEPSDKKEFFHF